MALASRASLRAARGPSPTGASATSCPGGGAVAPAGQQRAARRAEDDERDGHGDRNRGANQERRAPAPAPTLARGHGDAQRRRLGEVPLLAPERLHARGHVAQLGGDVVALVHAPSASIISRRRVSPRTMRALTVPMGMSVAALISLWLSSS